MKGSCYATKTLLLCCILKTPEIRYSTSDVKTAEERNRLLWKAE